jgi:hypothetical protein
MQITFAEWRQVAQKVKQRFPQASDHLRRLDRLFQQYDKDQSGTLDFGELHELLVQIDNKLTSLPATAQRAHQQGQYLGRKFNKMAQALPGMVINEMDYGDLDEAVYKAFEYKHLGSLAYIGNAAVFDINGLSFSGGLLAVYLWRSVYFAQSVSLRTRILLAMDWSKRALFGRGEFSSFPFWGVGDGWMGLLTAGDRFDELLITKWCKGRIDTPIEVKHRVTPIVIISSSGSHKRNGKTHLRGFKPINYHYLPQQTVKKLDYCTKLYVDARNPSFHSSVPQQYPRLEHKPVLIFSPSNQSVCQKICSKLVARCATL